MQKFIPFDSPIACPARPLSITTTDTLITRPATPLPLLSPLLAPFLPSPAVSLRASRGVSTIRAAMPIDRPSGGGARFPIAGSAAAATNGADAAAAPALQPVSITGEVSVTSVVSPAGIYERAAALGAYKAALPWWKTVLLGALAGCYVALGGALLLTVAPNCPGLASSNPGLQKYLMGAIGFPYALLIILTCGAELFTGTSTALITFFCIY